MNSHLSLTRLLGSKDFYPTGDLASKRHYAQRIGKKRLKQFAALYLSPNKQQEDIAVEELIAQWFTFNDQHSYHNSPSFLTIIDHMRRIRRFHKGEHLHLITTEALLKLNLFVHENGDLPDEVAEDASITIHLFHLNLLFNDEVLKDYEKAPEIAKRVQDDNYLQRLTLSMSFSQADFTNINYPQLLYTQFYKAIRLLDFMESNPKYQVLFERFLAGFQKDKTEFLKALGFAIVQGTSTKNGYNYIVVTKDEHYDENCAFLDQVAVTPEYQVTDQQDDYLPLRARPLDKTNPGEYLVPFPMFLVKKLYTGITFLLSNLQKAEPALLAGDFFGNIRADFSEEVLLYDVLSQLYLAVGLHRTGKQLKNAGMQRETDYYLRVNNTVVLHESKDFFMAGPVKLSYDFDLIEKCLKTDGKDSVPPKPDKLGKAVIQIAHNIERVLHLGIAGDNGYDPQTIEIFPVIVVYDSLYSAAGLNYWVHFWMEEEIAKLKAKPANSGLNFDNIMPVTLVEIDTLILYQTQLANNTLDYINLLREYHQIVNYGKKNILDFVKFARQSCIPFSAFVEDYCASNNIVLDLTPLNNLLTKYSIY